MNSSDSQSPMSPAIAGDERIAEAFMRARLAGVALAAFPGDQPRDLEAAYAVQDLAIARWPDRVIGWKVGYIARPRRDQSGDQRLLGPIFAGQVRDAAPGVEIEVFVGGFAAIEAEYVLRLDADAPAGKTEWTPEEAAAFPCRLSIGLEVASSPLASINALGPTAVVSDFGNNNGLIVGPEITGPEIGGWQALDEAGLRCEAFIDGASVGRGGAGSLPGGLRAALAFALSRSARRGRPLPAGGLVATGNATGIHDILPGQRARVVFGGHGEIEVVAVPVRGNGRRDTAA